VSDIQLLTETVSDLNHSVDFWNQLMLWGLGLTVIAGAFVLVATRLVIFRSGQLSAAQEALGAAKDRKLQSDLRAKDVKIAEANERAQTLEALIQPRYLTEAQQGEIANAVRPYGGPTALLLIGSHWNDPESTRLARQIKAALNRGSVGSGPNPLVDLIGKFPQVPVGLWGGGVIEGTEIHEGVEVWGRAGEAIAEALRTIGKIDAIAPPQSVYPFKFPLKEDRMIAVLVGLKPLPKVK